MADFSALLSKPADQIKRPPILPVGNYTGIVKSREFIESKQKKTPGVEYVVQLMEAGSDVDVSLLADIDITRKTAKVTYWLSPDAEFMAVEMIKSLGVNVSGRSLGEILEEPVGKSVMVYATHKMSQNNELFNEFRSMTGVS